HLVEHAFGLAIEVAFNSESRELVWHDSHCPTWSVSLRRATILIGTIGLDFRRSFIFVAVAEGAEAPLHPDGVAGKVSGALGALGRYNDPTADDGIFSEFGQVSVSSARCHPGDFILRRECSI